MKESVEIIDFDSLYQSMIRCQRNVSWKDSVAHFILNSIEEVMNLSDELNNGTYKEKPQVFFKVYVPKERDIVSITFRDRVYQRSLNDNCLYPSCTKHLIYDNFACQKGKGTMAAKNRIKILLHKYYRKHGHEGYVFQFDVKKYYPTMPHELVKKVFKKYVDGEPFNLACKILDTFEGDYGFNPGSQIIQIAGITVLNELDHMIKEKYHVKYYNRYMDDGIMIFDNKKDPEKIKIEIENYLNGIGFKLHEKKTKIYPLSKGIEFLGFVFKLDKTGGVISYVRPDKVKNDRRELKKLAYLVKEGRMTKKQFYQTYSGKRVHYSYGNNKKLLFKFDKYVKDLMEEIK